jgi:hypothetical protein
MKININNIIYEVPKEFRKLNSIKSSTTVKNEKIIIKINGYKLNIKNQQWEKGIIFKKIIPANIEILDS